MQICLKGKAVAVIEAPEPVQEVVYVKEVQEVAEKGGQTCIYLQIGMSLST